MWIWYHRDRGIGRFRGKIGGAPWSAPDSIWLVPGTYDFNAD